MIIFKDRKTAGQFLAKKLYKFKARKDVLVLGIPRGGVVVAAEIAKKLKLPLDIVITRKIGAPNQPELALGAVDPAGSVVWDNELLTQLELKITRPSFGGKNLKFKIKEELKEIKRRESLYRHTRPDLDAKDKVVILVDDGIATGATVLSAVKYLKSLGAKKIVVTAPVGASDSVNKISRIADEILVPYEEEYFNAVGAFYKNFEAIEDKEVISTLSRLSEN